MTLTALMWEPNRVRSVCSFRRRSRSWSKWRRTTPWRALWEAHQKGVKIKRGCRQRPPEGRPCFPDRANGAGPRPPPARAQKSGNPGRETPQDARVKVIPTLNDKRNPFEQLVPDDPSDEI